MSCNLSESDFIADSVEFRDLRPEVREMIRGSEAILREALAEFIQGIPASMALYLAGMEKALPQRFIHAHHWFYENLSALMNMAEAISREQTSEEPYLGAAEKIHLIQ